MHKNFRGFYTPKEEELSELWKDKNTLFIFDTNTLFNLYRCEEQTREELLNVMQSLSERSWYPFQVYYEYQRSRKEVISDSIKSLETIKKTLQSISTQTDKALSDGQIKKHLYSSLSVELSSLQSELNKPIEDYIKEKISPRIEQKNKIGESDFIRHAIDKIIGDNCGDIPTQELIDTINQDGEKRYADNIPPGFSDASTKKGKSYFSDLTFTDKFGDLYLWMEVLEKAKSCDGYNIFLISDDSKKDWWFIHSGKRIGPLEALQTEIYNKSKIKKFRMINQSSFLFEAKKYLSGVTISESSVAEVETFSQIDEDEYNYIEYEQFIDDFHPYPSSEIRTSKYQKSHSPLNISQSKNVHNNNNDYYFQQLHAMQYDFKSLEDTYYKLIFESEVFSFNERIHPQLKEVLQKLLDKLNNSRLIIKVAFNESFENYETMSQDSFKEFSQIKLPYISNYLTDYKECIKKIEALLA